MHSQPPTQTTSPGYTIQPTLLLIITYTRRHRNSSNIQTHSTPVSRVTATPPHHHHTFTDAQERRTHLTPEIRPPILVTSLHSLTNTDANNIPRRYNQPSSSSSYIHAGTGTTPRTRRRAMRGIPCHSSSEPRSNTIVHGSTWKKVNVLSALCKTHPKNAHQSGSPLTPCRMLLRAAPVN